MFTGGKCSKFQLLAELAEAAEAGFVCSGGALPNFLWVSEIFAWYVYQCYGEVMVGGQYEQASKEMGNLWVFPRLPRLPMASHVTQILLLRSPWAHVMAAARMVNSSCHWMECCGSRLPVATQPSTCKGRPHSLCYQKCLYRAGDPGPRPRLCPGTWFIQEGTGATTERLPKPGCLV